MHPVWKQKRKRESLSLFLFMQLASILFFAQTGCYCKMAALHQTYGRKSIVKEPIFFPWMLRIFARCIRKWATLNAHFSCLLFGRDPRILWGALLWSFYGRLRQYQLIFDMNNQWQQHPGEHEMVDTLALLSWTSLTTRKTIQVLFELGNGISRPLFCKLPKFCLNDDEKDFNFQSIPTPHTYPTFFPEDIFPPRIYFLFEYLCLFPFQFAVRRWKRRQKIKEAHLVND